MLSCCLKYSLKLHQLALACLLAAAAAKRKHDIDSLATQRQQRPPPDLRVHRAFEQKLRKGQADDGAYHNERGFPYANLDQARIDSCYLTNTYGFASGEFGSAYSRQPTGLKLRRGALMTERWLLLVDDMAAPAEHTLTWLCHADAPFQVEGTGFAAHLTNATLAVIPLSPAGLVSKMEPTIVGGGATLAETKPGSKITIQRGYHLNLSMAQPAKSVRFVTLLVPLQSNEKLPEIQATTIEQDHIRFGLKWPGGKTEKVDLNLRWRSESGSGPATIKLE